MCSILRSLLFAAAASPVAAHFIPRATNEHGGVLIRDFGYSGALGAANWHSLNITTNQGCGTGLYQSPVDLVDGVYTEVAGSGFSIFIPDFDKGATFENIGTAVEIVGDGGNMTIPSHSNKTFNFAQFHFHLPSEHLDNGTSMAMELHMVFQAADSEIAVLGTFIDVTADTASADTMLETVLASVGDIATPGTATTTAKLVMSEVVAMLSATTFKSYSGSLTTPPCSEGVNWFVASDTLSVTLDTWKIARDVIGFNSRFAQGVPGEENVLSRAAQGMTLIQKAGLS